ncbi:MAG: glycosyltransferase family 2 protein [Bacteroidetes bacterium]|jgi:dolichol-phosphate mannosyltransferase|nr:glycosyltransferase family 2 protein [Bacteroidota bacterium]MBK9301404.1 glycosyltransferase family 2 protein [Bacteroidota bacterium]MBK9483512.1 glycosyltransferase family 2 protein [Bacteroidota bacterium]
MAIKNLWVIMPVYNEEEAIELVVNEWVAALETLKINYVLCLLNDGSKDDTLLKINNLANNYSKLKIINKSNSGHGQTCVMGYQMAIENGADWVFQIDSDGQCDAQYFKNFIPYTDSFQCIYGVRKTRDDGMQRTIVSYFVTLFTWVATGKWVRDPNVPYRLIHVDVLSKFVYKVPVDFHLANIFVSVCCAKLSQIKWIPIHFRDRMGGTASVKTFSFVKHGFKLFKQLRHAMKVID